MSGPHPVPPGAPQASGPRSVAAAGGIDVAITGDGARVVMLPPEAVRWAREVNAPPGAANLPGSASGMFVGRGRELARLRELLAREGEAAVTPSSSRTRAIHGLGGIGKSSLALRYAHEYRTEYTLVWWITAESAEQITTGLAALALRLCPHWAAAVGVPERAAWAILWLQWHPGWLLVFDNVEDPKDLRHCLGALPDGHHLATSRKATGWHDIAPTMALGLLDPDASADLLCALALGPGQSPTGEQRRQAEDLAAELGYLPLALEQAGAYLYQTGTELGAYRRLLGRVVDRAADGTDPERTIARVWNHTLSAIEGRDPLAARLLHTMAWLAPDDIFRTLLAPVAPDPVALGDALGVLHAYNMIAFTADRQGLTVHRLVQTVLRIRATAESPTAVRGWQEAEQGLCQAMPDADAVAPERDARWERLLPHIFALAESAPPDRPASSQLADLYQDAAHHLDRQGRNADSVPLRTAVVAHRERVLGDTHPATLTSRNNLAGAYEDAGDPGRAIPLFESTLAQRERVLGDAHPATLRSRNNLALAYSEAGHVERAIPMFEATLAQREQVLGDTHPATLTSRNNLALAYKRVGDLERAIPLCETTLAQREQVLGDAHPETLTSRNNLARAYRAAGDLARAIALSETALAQSERVLGDTHRDTLTLRNNLAGAYVAAGEPARAVPLYEATLAQREGLLGPTHPATLRTRANLAIAYEKAGDPARAMPLYESAVADFERVLGDTHPDTVAARKNLAAARRDAQAVRRSGAALASPGSPGRRTAPPAAEPSPPDRCDYHSR
ncbi:tetratricopeptide repeat protein [Streptomyces sp. NPDC004629]|uniref:tetratricopeptide repeat protein n=1 Tax=Streptomyces sp. NPDC004629 TaxID=3364705 RepID=UPI0036C49C4A